MGEPQQLSMFGREIPVKPSCPEGDNQTIENMQEQFERFINYRHVTGVAHGIRSLCRPSEANDATE